MSPVETYLLDLRAALGDRLPPALTEARLREARAHLLASAEDVGEGEAIRRYGNVRAVVNGLIRMHRGYDTRTAWSLTLPVAAAFVATGLITIFFIPRPLNAGPVHMLVFAMAFAFRAAQTRRWIAAPMATAQAAAGLFLLFLNHLTRPHPWMLSQILMLTLYIALFAAAWTLINALALATGRLLDLRRVRSR